MKPTKKGTMGNRFHKLVKHIVDQNSANAQANAMAVEDEADAIDQEGKKRKPKPRDLDTGWNK